MANLSSTEQSPMISPSAGLSGRRRTEAFAFGGLLLMLMNFSGPGSGMLDLFITAMLVLVGGDNYLMLFVGWEGVGLCSFLLIGFWYDAGTGALLTLLLIIFLFLFVLVFCVRGCTLPSWSVHFGNRLSH